MRIKKLNELVLQIALTTTQILSNVDSDNTEGVNLNSGA